MNPDFTASSLLKGLLTFEAELLNLWQTVLTEMLHSENHLQDGRKSINDFLQCNMAYRVANIHTRTLGRSNSQSISWKQAKEKTVKVKYPQ